MLVAFGSRTDPNQVEIRAVKTKDQQGQRERAAAATMMPMLQSTYRGAVSSLLIISWQGLPQESDRGAGRDGSTAVSRRAPTRSGARGAAVADSWAHPAVPLSGAVRTAGGRQAVRTMELVGVRHVRGAAGEQL